MTPSDYSYLAALLLETSGLALGPSKEYLLEARLVPVAQSCGLAGIEELICELRKEKRGVLTAAVTEAMTTNETSFFRDRTPFEDLKRHMLPRLIEARQRTRTLRMWCAAASSGQEPYSVLMLLDEHFPELRKWSVEFIATDISNATLTRAEAGVYTQFEVQRGMSIQMLMKHFEQTPAGWQIKPDLRKRIRFRNLNLLDNFEHLGSFDIVFCRNVLIYFDIAKKKQILERIHARTRPDGFLLLGAAETVLGITSSFTRFRDCTSAVHQPTSDVTA